MIAADCAAFGHVFRNRKLPPQAVILHFLHQVLAGNTSCAQVRQFEDAAFTAAAYCRARMRLPLEVIQCLLLRVASPPAGGLWCGRRTLLVDGTSCSMPDTDELRGHFGYPGGPKPGLGFPCAHILCLFDHATGMLLENIVAPRCTHDLEGLPDLLAFMKPDDVLVGDRGFGFFVTMALCKKHRMDAVLRLKSDILVDFTPGRPHHHSHKSGMRGVPQSRWVRSLGEQDQVVVYPKSKMKSTVLTQEEWDALPEELEVRELRVRVDKIGWRPQVITIVATLLDAEQFPKEKIVELYLARWAVEGNIRDLKQTLKMDTLKGRSLDVVKKEIAMHAIAYNLIQWVRMEGARLCNVPRCRISFADAMRWLAWNRNPVVLAKLIINPLRLGRFDIRAVKRRPKTHGLLMRPRREAKLAILAKVASQNTENKRLAA